MRLLKTIGLTLLLAAGILGINHTDCFYRLFFAGNTDYCTLVGVFNLFALFIYLLLLDSTKTLLGLLLIKLLPERSITKSKILLRQLVPVTGNSIGRIDKAVHTI